MSKCETCWPETGCYRPENYFTYYVDEYGDVKGDDMELAMMTEIYNHGPISCGIAVTDDLVAYTGGIYTDINNSTEVCTMTLTVTHEWIIYNTRHSGPQGAPLPRICFAQLALPLTS